MIEETTILSKETRHILDALATTVSQIADECNQRADRLVANAAVNWMDATHQGKPPMQEASEAIRLRGEARGYLTVRDGIRQTLARSETPIAEPQSMLYRIKVDVGAYDGLGKRLSQVRDEIEDSVRGWACPRPFGSKPRQIGSHLYYYFVIPSDISLSEFEAIQEIRDNLAHLDIQIDQLWRVDADETIR